MAQCLSDGGLELITRLQAENYWHSYREEGSVEMQLY